MYSTQYSQTGQIGLVPELRGFFPGPFPTGVPGADEGHMAHWGTSSLQRFEAEDISKPEYPVQKCQLSFSLNSKGHLKIQCFQFW